MRRSIMLLLFVSIAAYSQSDWWNDVLIWNFSGGVTSPGTGFQNYDGLYGADGGVYAAAVENRPGNPEGDLIVLRKSYDHGYSWTRQNTITIGQGNHAFTPRIVFCDGGSSVILFAVFSFYNGETAACAYKFGAQNLNLISYSIVDSSYPGMGDIRSLTVNPGCGGYYFVMMETLDNWLFLSASPDADDWSPAQPVAANVSRASATGGAGTNVAVTWYDVYQQAVLCATGSSAGINPPVKVSDAPSDASPIPVWEENGSGSLGIVWRSAAGMVTISISQDNGATWSAPQALAAGAYPFADIFNGTSGVVVSFVSPSGQVFTGSADNLSQASSIVFEQRSDHPAWTQNPAVVRHSGISNGMGLFYLSGDGKDLWFDNSLFGEGIGEAGASPLLLSVVPNPSSGPVAISISPDLSGAEIRVFSLDGRVVWTGATADGGVQFDESLPAGVYTVSARTGGTTVNARMLRL